MVSIASNAAYHLATGPPWKVAGELQKYCQTGKRHQGADHPEDHGEADGASASKNRTRCSGSAVVSSVHGDQASKVEYSRVLCTHVEALARSTPLLGITAWECLCSVYLRKDTCTNHLVHIQEDDGYPADVVPKRRAGLDGCADSFLVRRSGIVSCLFSYKGQVTIAEDCSLAVRRCRFLCGCRVGMPSAVARLPEFEGRHDYATEELRAPRW